MKKSFLLLPLVATLAACNKTTPNNDIFTKARARKVPSATKQGVIDRYDDVDMFFTLEETSTVYKKQNGEWVVDGEPAIYTNYYWTVCSLDQDRPACYLASKFDDSYIPYFTVESIEGKAKYSPDTDELTIKNWLNNASASKIFKTVLTVSSLGMHHSGQAILGI